MKRISNLDELINYFTRIMDSKECAPTVCAIPLALLGAVLWRKDADAQIEVRGYGASTGRMLFVKINGQRYAFRHNRDDRSIELRLNDHKGEIRARFTNKTSVTEVRSIFETL